MQKIQKLLIITSTILFTFIFIGSAYAATPVAVQDYEMAYDNVSKNIDVLSNDFDADGDKLTLIAATAPTNGSLTLNPDQTLRYTSNPGFVGDDGFSYSISDGKGGIAYGGVTVYVLNAPPIAKDDYITINEDDYVQVYVTANDSDVEGDPFRLSGIEGPSHGYRNLNFEEGWISYLPEENYNGPDSIQYWIREIGDQKYGMSTATLHITVNPVNDAPNVLDYNKTIAEDTTLNDAVVGTDIDSTTLSYSLRNPASYGPFHGLVVVNSDGTYTYTPNANFIGYDFFYVIVSDGFLQDISRILINVTPVNDAPVTTDDSKTTDEDTPVSGTVTANDVDNDALNYSKGLDPAKGTVTVNADGSYIYTPKANLYGTDSFTVIVSDGNGGTATSTITVNIIPVNDAPVANDDSKTTDEDTPISGLAGADIDGDSLTFVLGTGPYHGTVTIKADGTYTYTPEDNYYGSDSFTFTVNDGNGETDEATVTLTVNSVNDAPTVPDYNKTIAEDTTLNDAVIGSDVDGNPLTYALGTGPKNGSVTVNADGTYTYTPNSNFNGSDSFTVIVSDGKGGTDEATVTITVTPVNDAPVAQDDSVTTDEDTSTVVTVLPNDSDVDAGDILIVTDVTQPANGLVTLVSGIITYKPADDWLGSETFTYTISDGKEGTATATVTINVNSVNDAPVTTDDSKTTDEDTPVSGTVTATDVDVDSLTFTKGTGPSNGNVVINTDGTYTYTPDTNFNGNDSFTVIVSDGKGGTDEATVNITVNAVNDAPVANPDTATTDEDTPVSGSVTGTDVDGNPLTYALGTGPSNGNVVVNTDGTYTYTPEDNYYGSDSFTFTVNDGNGETDDGTVSITVNAVNDTPVAIDDTATTKEETPVIIDVLENDSDVDEDTLSVTGVSDPANGTATINADGTVTYTPKSNWNGLDTFTVIANDGNGGTDEATVTITVTPVNDAPVATGDSKTTNEDTSVSGSVTGSDVDGDSLTYTPGTGPSNGNVVVNADGTYTYTPNTNYHGTDSFNVIANDDNGGTDAATVSITVNSVNDAPVTSNDSATTKEDKSANIDVIANDSDVDGDPLTVNDVSDPAHGTTSINANGTVNYTPDADYYGDDSFTYTIIDGNGGETTGTVNITVNRIVASIYVLTTFSKNNPTVGETITLTFKLGNNGPDAADDVVFTYVIPEGMEFVSLETEPGYPAAVYDPATRTITWKLGTVPILDPWLNVNVKVLKAGIFNINPTVTTSTYDPTISSSVQLATVNAVQAASAASNTVPMQNTGMPLVALILGLMAVFAGLLTFKQK